MKIYLLVGCPGAGKSWIAEQVEDLFCYVPHDRFHHSKSAYYVEAIARELKYADKPILAEAPFSISEIKGPLIGAGLEVECVFIQEVHDVIADRYLKSRGKTIPKGHLTRQTTYWTRALESGEVFGTTEKILEYLKNAGKNFSKKNKANQNKEGTSEADTAGAGGVQPGHRAYPEDRR